MKEKIKKIFGVIIALTMIMTIMPLSSKTVYADTSADYNDRFSGWKEYDSYTPNAVPTAEQNAYINSRGYKFLGWSSVMDDKNSIVTTEPTSGTYYAVWENSYGNVVVTKELDSSSIYSASDKGITLSTDGTTMTLTNVSIDGDFTWYFKKDGESSNCIGIDLSGTSVNKIVLVGDSKIGKVVDSIQNFPSNNEPTNAIKLNLNTTITGAGNLTLFDIEQGINTSNSITFDNNFTGKLSVIEKIVGQEGDQCCIKANSITIKNGTFDLQSKDGNALDANTVNIDGGTLSLNSNTKAINCSETLSIDENLIVKSGDSAPGTTTSKGSDWKTSIGDKKFVSIAPAIPVHYINEDGQDVPVTDYTVLTTSDANQKLPSGTYVVNSNIEARIIEIGSGSTVNLILCDGAKINLPYNESGNGLWCNGTLNIYGQTNNTGVLEWHTDHECVTNVSGTLNIYGGTIIGENTDGYSAGISIWDSGSIDINGGNLILKSDYKVISSDTAVTIGSGMSVYGDTANKEGTNAIDITDSFALANYDNYKYVKIMKTPADPLTALDFTVDYSVFSSITENTTYYDLLEMIAQAFSRTIDESKMDEESLGVSFIIDEYPMEYYVEKIEDYTIEEYPALFETVDMTTSVKIEYFVEFKHDSDNPFAGVFEEPSTFENSNFTITLNNESISYGVYPENWSAALAGEEKITAEPYEDECYFYISLGTVEEIVGLTPTSSDFSYNSSTGVVSAADEKDLGTITTYYKVDGSWTTTKPTTAGTYEVGVVTTGSNTYNAIGSSTEPFTDSSWKYTVSTAGQNDNGEVKIPENKQDGNFEAGGIKNSADEVKAAVLTAEDKAAMEEGKDVFVWVEIEDLSSTVSETDKKLIEDALEQDNVVGIYLDISLWKQITGSDAVKITKTPNGKVKIGFKIPSNLQKEGRTYKIIRIHNGVATVIDAKVDEQFNLTFETDEFSTYALVYTEAVSENEPENPETGDRNMTPWLAVMIAALGVVGYIENHVKKKTCKN